MAAMSDYLENKWIDWFFRGATYSPPSGLYVALFTAAPSDAGGGTEVSGNNYARVNLAPSTSNWAASNAAGSTASTSSGTGGTTSNNATISFPTPSGAWGTITHVGIYDAATAGNLLFWAALVTSRTVTDSGTPFSIAPGALSVQIDN